MIMKALIPFTLPVSGMGNGTHHFDFRIDDEFFAAFEDSPVHHGRLSAHLEFDKQASMYVLRFSFDGTVRVTCDRCLEPFDLPIEDEQKLLVKFGDNEGNEDPDVVYIPYGTTQLEVAQYFYEYVLLAIPLSRVHEDAEESCDPEMLDFLSPAPADEEPPEDDAQSPWDALKNFKQ